jgi:hypothetical protein
MQAACDTQVGYLRRQNFLLFLIMCVNTFLLFTNWRVWRLATGWATSVRFPAEVRDFCLLHRVQTASGAHPMVLEALAGVVIIIWFVRLLTLWPLLAYCASLG